MNKIKHYNKIVPRILLSLLIISIALIPQNNSYSASAKAINSFVPYDIQSSAITTGGSPSSTSGSWANPTNAYTDGSNEASITSGLPSSSQVYGNYGFNIVSNATQVKVRYDAWCLGSGDVSSQTRYPTGDFSASGTWAVYPTSPTTKWDKVDETTFDSDTTYLTHGTSSGNALFSFPVFTIPASATITNLQLIYTARDVTSGANNVRSALRIGGTNYTSTDTGYDMGTGYLTPTYTYSVNPRTSSAWLVNDINGSGANPLQAFGIASTDANPAFRITAVKVVVNYVMPTTYDDQIRVDVSWDSGITWSAQQVSTLTDSEATYYYDVTKATNWTPDKLNDTNFKVRVDALTSGTPSEIRLDWVSVEVTTDSDYTSYTPMSDGVITFTELKADVEADSQYMGLTFDDWDLLSTQKGINHIDDELLDEYVTSRSNGLTELYAQLDELYSEKPTQEQIAQINSALSKYETQKIPLTSALATIKSVELAKVGGDASKLPESSKALIQEAANKVAEIDGKISEVQKPLQIPDQIKECERAIGSIKDKFACAIKEQEFREQSLVERTFVHSTYYMDFTPATHSHLTGTVTFTNGSATVSGDGTNFDPEVTVNDYIRQSDGTQWYKVTARASDTSLTISPAFQQATHTDDAGATFCCVSATNNGTTTSLAFPHLNRYTTDTTRTAGDILKVRANQTNVIAGVNITFDEAGTVTQYNEVRGCSVADDPFSDASDVQPIFDFGNTSSQIVNPLAYWRLFNLVIQNNNSTTGLIYITWVNFKGGILDTIVIQNNNNANGKGIQAIVSSIFNIINCTFSRNGSSHIYTAGIITVSGSTFNKGAATAYAINLLMGKCDVSNSTFGVTTAHSTSTFTVDARGLITARDCIFSESTVISWINNNGMYGDFLTSEDDGQVFGASKAWYYSGTVTKCAVGLTDETVREGGGSSSALMFPSSAVTIKYPLTIAYGSLNPDFAINCPASETTVTVYIRSHTAWGTYPTAAQLFIQADYLDDADSAHRAQSTASTQVLSDGSTWVAFTTTFTPAQAGLAYLKVNFGLYTATEGIYVDVKPIVS